jgi:hypothetical protein
MTMRLNGWQRIGIVASVIWAIAGPLYLRQLALDSAVEQSGFVHRVCRNGPTDPAICLARSEQAFDEAIQGDLMAHVGWGPWAAKAFIPVLVGWLLVYALVYLVRWVRAGFKS